MNRLLAVAVAIVGFALLSGASRIVPPETRSFVYVKGTDTVGGETFTHSAALLSGDILLDNTHMHYEARLAADGTIPRLDIRASRPGTAAQTTRLISVTVGRDSVRLTEQLGKKADTLRLASQPGLLPFINLSMGLTEVVIARARAQKSRLAKVPVIIALEFDSLATTSLRGSRADIGQVAVTFMSADSIRLGTIRERDNVRVVIASDGHIRSAVSGADAKDHFKMLSTSKPVPRSQ